MVVGTDQVMVVGLGLEWKSNQVAAFGWLHVPVIIPRFAVR